MQLISLQKTLLTLTDNFSGYGGSIAPRSVLRGVGPLDGGAPELILLQVDLRTLLAAAQRTCRSWKTLIRDSPSLQKYLYPMPDESVSKSRNPLLADAFPSFFSRDGTSADGLGRFTFATFDMIQQPDKITVYSREEASWRCMLVQQPPRTGIRLFRRGVVTGGEVFTEYHPGRFSRLTPSCGRMRTATDLLCPAE